MSEFPTVSKMETVGINAKNALIQKEYLLCANFALPKKKRAYTGRRKICVPHKRDLGSRNFCDMQEIVRIVSSILEHTPTDIMAQEEVIKLFDAKKIRIVWDDEAEKYYFSVVDVIQVLTDTPNAQVLERLEEPIIKRRK